MKLAFRKIETKEQMLEWAKEINFLNPIKCDMQDIYAHSKREDLDRFFIELEGERKLVICSVNNVMAFEEVEHLLSVLAKHKVSQQMKIEYKELDERISEFESTKNDYTEMNEKIVEIEIELNGSRKEYNKLYTDSRVWKEKARKYDAIKEALL